MPRNYDAGAPPRSLHALYRRLDILRVRAVHPGPYEGRTRSLRYQGRHHESREDPIRLFHPGKEALGYFTSASLGATLSLLMCDDAKAEAKVVLTIDPSLYVHIKHAATNYDLWEKLKNLFDDTGYTRKIGFLRKLINIRLENCDSMTQYVTQIVETSQRLQGDVNIITVVKDVEYDITVSDVLCVPSLTTNLLSGTLVGKAEQVDGVYRLYTKDVEQILAATAKTSSETWHRRLGHINSASMNKMKMELLKPSSSNTENVLDLVHSDVCGPMENVSIGGSRYYILFVDDHSKMAFIYFMKAKSEAFKYFKEFQSMVENQKNRKIKVFRTDNGGEYCNKDFDRYLKQQGIIHQRTNPYTPEQNGVCERMNRSLVEKARCLIFDASLHKKFWAEAMHTSVYLRNRSVVTGLNDMTPYEVWTGTSLT
ncbi:Retrovirus-related Pol polyprotein from transposon TNT 1-94 [Eumeta japonica]|uniref:Retrovirus-related Pol polyprotein from transposon TNT 1-94 n=1 Tax=Eumeta variegata TaxID=151549 RepID=A0A4C1UUQ0_EUMVA|nr:Retrovirus-related Pol polyprotein from transposon TNT 1-94 [Eumeta japonica]